MHPAIYIGAAAGFFGGYFGYLLIRFTILPILAYRRLKNRTGKILKYAETPENLYSDKLRAQEVRSLSIQWADYCTERLPGWYGAYLRQRYGETPMDVSALLMKLSGTKNPDHAGRQIEKIRKHLRIE